MKRNDLIKKLKAAAKTQGLEFGLIREGANHTLYAVGTRMIPVPRHREINERTADGIIKAAETAGEEA